MQVEQVFLYVTSKCQVGCLTCYMQDTYHGLSDMPLETAMSHLRLYKNMGAWKLSILGGEPTLYPYLGDLLTKAKKMGYSFIRINTNGQFASKLLRQEEIQQLDTICFSIDGHTEDLNAQIRRGSSLKTILENMTAAHDLNYDVRVNCTVTSLNLQYISEIIELSSINEASVIYLNVVYMMGAATQNSHLSVSPEDWRQAYEEIVNGNCSSQIKIKIPPAYALPNESTVIDGIEHKCLAIENSRVYVLPNSQVYPCLLFFSSPNLQMNGPNGEYVAALEAHTGVSKEQINSHCHFFSSSSGPYLPLCIYHKRKLNYPNMT